MLRFCANMPAAELAAHLSSASALAQVGTPFAKVLAAPKQKGMQ
jgi:hypothetical protein